MVGSWHPRRSRPPRRITWGCCEWAEQLADGDELLWAIEDCRHLSRRLERDLLAAGQSIVRVATEIDGARP